VEGVVTFDQVRTIIGQRCITCHASVPTFPGIAPSPAGVSFESPVLIAQHAQRIYQQVVSSRIMPLGNVTESRLMLWGFLLQIGTSR
jgi:uncharacterized membrane protein